MDGFDASSAVAALRMLFSSGERRDESLLAGELPTVWDRLGGKEHGELRAELDRMRAVLVAREAARYEADRERIRQGDLRGGELLSWIEDCPPQHRELAIEQLLGVAHRPLGRARLGAGLIGYVPCGFEPVVRAVIDLPLTAADVFVDLGSGLGKATMLAHLLTGAAAQGIELQSDLVAHANERALDLRLPGVSHETADARRARLQDGNVFFLYLPFTGTALEEVMARLRAEASRRAIVVCALGVDLGCFGWLRAREPSSFWLTLYDSRVEGVPPRARSEASPLRPHAAWLYR